MSRSTKPAAPMIHIMFGAPDDDCEICRAHGITKESAKVGGGVVMGPITRHQALECTCPLCAALLNISSTKGWGGL